MKKLIAWISVLALLMVSLTSCAAENADQNSLQNSEEQQEQESEALPEIENGEAPEMIEDFTYDAAYWPEDLSAMEGRQIVRWGYFSRIRSMRAEIVNGVNECLESQGIGLQIVEINCSRSPLMEEIRQTEKDLGISFDIITTDAAGLSNQDIAEYCEKLNPYMEEGGALAEAYQYFSEDVWKISDMKGAYYNLGDFAQFKVPAYTIINLPESVELDQEQWQNQPWEQVDDLIAELYEANQQQGLIHSSQVMRLDLIAKLNEEMTEIWPGLMIDSEGTVGDMLSISKDTLPMIQKWYDKGYVREGSVADYKGIHLLFSWSMEVDQTLEVDQRISIPRGKMVYAERCNEYTLVMQTAPAKQAALAFLNQALTDEATAQALCYGKGREYREAWSSGIVLATSEALVPEVKMEKYGYSSRKEYIEAMADRVLVSPWQTFLVDQKPIREQLEAVSKYWNNVGTVDFVSDNSQWDAIYENYGKQMQEKQIDAVLSEVQRQVDEWK